VLVLEKKGAAGQDICCTGIVSRECLDLLHLDDNLIMRQVSSARFLAPSGKPVSVSRNQTVAYVIDRPALNTMLADRAKECGVFYLFGAQVTNIKIESGSLQVSANCRGHKKTFEAESAVIATGFGSPLPGRLGLGEIKHFVVGAQTEVNVTETDEVEIYLDRRLAPGCFAWLVPTRDNKGLAGLLTHQQPKQYLKKLLSTLKSQGKITSDEVSPGFSIIPLRPLPRTYADRIIVVGEAAGQVKPTTGGGIYYGLICADIAADTLHNAFQAHDLSKSRLASYQKNWYARLGKELQVGYWAHLLYQKLDNRQIERLHSFIDKYGIPQFIAGLDDFPFDWHSELILKILKHLVTAIPSRAIKPAIKNAAS